MKRMVFEPKRSVRPPIFSSPMAMSGCLPVHEMAAMTAPDTSVIWVRRRSNLGKGRRGGDFCWCKEDEDEDTEERAKEDEGMGDSESSEGTRPVTIWYAS